MMNFEYLAGHLFYVLVHEDYKKRARGLKYLGQAPIYRLIKIQESRTMNRVPAVLSKEFVDKLEKYEYIGLYDLGAKEVPAFKLKLEVISDDSTKAPI
jgi:hypothetical protein